ncbi:DUF167 domain-containing protein [Parvularcula flava]|uniref:UPF0235 protein FF098_011325 n=1 Tax=Aquisalinus luteolus TaxID=1566827 RepID=A0A8J3A449_9PROT|nr:DUF167 family protein [Aquisalinus luteolus]NHK28498.1 DUF167 domain-containing protein [Aquisalinus luteolus]GGH98658.1 hypothetical protein GCM10011355_22770 [Aquisalinus luteolus]
MTIETIIAVRVQPNASRDAVEGFATDADGAIVLKVRVSAVPDKGKANKAVIKLLAAATGLPKSAISIIAGGKSRSKTVRFEASAEMVRTALETASPNKGTSKG